ncbi:MAG: efflux RND transporter permease subunit [Clostridiales bacterium]|nr:efflux RND transporter permease subunit [Clostridiales bacterium]
MKKVIKSLLSHKIIILIISLLLILLGIYSYINIPKQEMPEIKLVYGYIQATAPGLNSIEIEEKVTSHIENIISDYSGVDSYTATSVDNACFIAIEMNIGNSSAPDILKEIESEILNTKFDDSVTEIVFLNEMNTPEVIYAVHSNELTEAELKTLAGDLADHLNKIENVAKTEVDSAYSEEIVVTIDYETLNNYPVTISDIYNIILANGMEIPLGNAKFNGESTSLLVDSNYSSTEEIENLVLFADETNTYRISDIADVEKQDTDNKKVYEFNGDTTAFVEVYFEENLDFTVLGDEIKDAVDDFIRKYKGNAEITAMTFSPDYVRDQVNSVMINLLLCVLIVMIVVLLGLGIRNSIVIAITIPVIVLSTIGLLYLLGNHLQLMSIAGLIVSIGILVDNSIVISEAVQHELDSGKVVGKACIKAIKDNYLPVLTSTLTTVAAFIPLMYLPGIAGDVAYTLPLTILIAITLSYIVAMTLTPTLACIFFKPKKIKKKKAVNFQKVVSKTLKVVFKFSIVPTLVAFIVLGGLGYLVVQELEIDILPKTEKSIVYVDYEFNELNDGEGTFEFAKSIESVVNSQEDVINYAFSQGGNLPNFYMTLDVVSNLPHNGRFFIEYDCDAIELEDYMKNLENDLYHLREQGEIRINRLEMSFPSAPVRIILMSNDFEKLLLVSDKIFKKVETLGNFKSGALVAPAYKTDLVVKIDRDKANQNGLTVVEIEQQVALNINGFSEYLYSDDENLLKLRVITEMATKDDFVNMNIKSSTGDSIALNELAELTEVENIEYIETYNGTPSVTIDAYMADGVSTYALENDIREIIEDNTDKTIDVVYKGDNELTNEIFTGLIFAFAIALFFIYLIMYFQFRSLKQPMIILVSIPLSLIGSLATLLILGEKITLTSLLGVVSLVGIVVNNGILLVDYINKQHQKGNSIFDSCVKAVSRRIRPIVLSSLTTVLGLLPLAIFGGDFFRPMAVTFMGGMMISAVLVLIVVPGLYYFAFKKKDKK